MRRRFAFVLPLLFWIAGAHPMGNFSVSHYTRIEPTASNGVQVKYVLDLAELPTFELIQKAGLKQDTPLAELKALAEKEARQWGEGLRFRANGLAVKPRFLSSELVRGDGAGAMQVFRITALFAVDAKPGVLEFEDTNYPERNGWKEIVVAGQNVTKSNQGTEDRTKGLTEYPADAESAPRQDLQARLEWTALPASSPVVVTERESKQAAPSEAAGAGKSTAGAGELKKGDILSELVSQKELSPSIVLLSLVLAFAFGCWHATMPGHGKTMVAAYLVGQRGTPKHALLLGLATTFTHTVSVFLLGVATYFLAGTFAPDKVTKILEFVSGMSIVVLGVWLVYKRLLAIHAAGSGDDHHHGGFIAHHHHHHGDGGGHHHMPEGEVSLGSLLTLGASGGLVPCPSALVLLLTSISFGRVGFGLLLLVAFSVGLASVLVAIGLVVVFAKNRLPSMSSSSNHAFFKFVPVLSACVIVLVGVVLTGVSLGIVKTGY
jgi:nickel/cobalt exporter